MGQILEKKLNKHQQQKHTPTIRDGILSDAKVPCLRSYEISSEDMGHLWRKERSR